MAKLFERLFELPILHKYNPINAINWQIHFLVMVYYGSTLNLGSHG